MKRLELTGKCFGMLTARKYLGGSRWICDCKCGGTSTPLASALISGNSKSCGCRQLLAAKSTGELNKKHGMAGTLECNSWTAAINRCYNKKIPSYKFYGACGIFMCEFLRASPINLINLLGKRTHLESLDRINNKGNYSCGNCAECLQKGMPLNVRWADHKTQNRNRRNSVNIVIDGVTKHITQWAKENNITVSAIRHRMLTGKSGTELLSPYLCKR